MDDLFPPFAPDPNEVADLISQADTLDDEETQVDAAENGLDGAPIEGPAVNAETDANTGEGAPVGGSVVDEGEALDPFEGEADLPDTSDDAPEAAERDEEQEAYRVAAE